jgi:hypothetical protein
MKAGRMGRMGLMVALGAALAIAVCVAISAKAFLVWGAIGLVLVVVFAAGAHGSAESGGESEISDLTFQKPGKYSLSKEECMRLADREGDHEVGAGCLPGFERDLQEEITRRSRISKTT